MSCSVCYTCNERMFNCIRCKNAIYCGKNCQTKDWAEHKKICARTDVLRPSTFPQFARPSLKKENQLKQKTSKAMREFEDGLLEWSEKVKETTEEVDDIWHQEMRKYGVSDIAMEASEVLIKDVQNEYNKMISGLLYDSEFKVEGMMNSVQNFTTLMYTGANLDIDTIAKRETRTQDQLILYTLADAVVDIADSISDMRDEDNAIDTYEDELEASQILSEENSDVRIESLITFFKSRINGFMNSANQCLTNEEYQRTMNDQWNRNRRARRKQQQKFGNILITQILDQIPEEADNRKKWRICAYIDRVLDRVNKYREEGEFLEYAALESAFEMSVLTLSSPLDDDLVNLFRVTLYDQFSKEKESKTLIRYDGAIAAFDDVTADMDVEAEVYELKQLFTTKLRNYTKSGKWRNTYKWFSLIFQAVGAFFAILVAKKVFTYAQDQFKDSIDAMIGIFKETAKETEATKILLMEAKKDLAIAKSSASKLVEARKKLVPLLGADTNSKALVENLGLQESKELTLEVLKARKASIIGEYAKLQPPTTPDGKLQIYNEPTTVEEMDSISIELLSIDHQAKRVASITTSDDLVRQMNGIRAGIQGTASVAYGQDAVAYQEDIVRQAAVIARCQENVAKSLEKLNEVERLQIEGETETLTDIAEAQKYISTYTKFLEFVQSKTGSETITSFFDAYITSPLNMAERVFKRMKNDPKFSFAVRTLSSRGIGTAASIAQFLGKWGGSVFMAFLQIQQILNIGQILGYTVAGVAWSIDQLTAKLQSLIFPKFGEISLTDQIQLINAGVNMTKTAKGLWFTTALVRLLSKSIQNIAVGFAGWLGIIQWYGTIILAVVSAASFLYTAITGSLVIALAELVAGSGILPIAILTATGLYAVVYALALFFWKYSPNYYYPIMLRLRYCIEAGIRVSTSSIIGYSVFSSVVSAVKTTVNSELNIQNIWGLKT